MRVLCLFRLAGKKPENVVVELKKIKGVEDAFLTFGRFDGVAVLNVPGIESCMSAVKAIQSNPGIRRTETLAEV
ncbi:MAG TPA: Lrp/AsnC ligand binding domain-containing protein [Thermoproteota archaeon]|nr:Lrp/AsnC ligand binding domain-containing protein [Thermoproteota archaeon]